MSHMDFSSWPREQEATFVVYEERISQAQKKAWTVALATAAIVFVAALGIYAGVEPDKTDISKDMNMSNLSRKGGDKK